MAEQMGTGWMPTFPEVSGDSRRMNSNHGIPTFADALAKGLKIDVKAAYEAGRKALTEKTLVPWSGNPAGELDSFYWEHGYIPALRAGEVETDPNVGWENRQPVAVSLGTAYDSWALSKLAEAAGNKEDAVLIPRLCSSIPKTGTAISFLTLITISPEEWAPGIITTRIMPGYIAGMCSMIFLA